MIEGVSPDLPHTDELPATREWGLRVLRRPVAVLLRTWWRVQLHEASRVPAEGPVILAANHIGLLDGPVLVALTRRLTFAMPKRELFVGVLGRVSWARFRHRVPCSGPARASRVPGNPPRE